MSNTRLKYLFEQHVAKTCTEAEKQELAVMLLSPQYADDVKALLEHGWEKDFAYDNMPAENAEAIIQSILSSSDQNTKENKTRIVRLWPRIAAAAAIVLVLGAAYYFIFNNKENKIVAAVKPQQTEKINSDIIAPTKAKAMITLADGRKVPLDSITSGTLATQGDVNLVKTANGQLIYNAAQQTEGQIQYNTLSNPRGSRVVDRPLPMVAVYGLMQVLLLLIPLRLWVTNVVYPLPVKLILK
ncbi:MAG: hypothetical protein WDM90_25210 [Ferruginibacter sp.]